MSRFQEFESNEINKQIQKKPTHRQYDIQKGNFNWRSIWNKELKECEKECLESWLPGRWFEILGIAISFQGKEPIKFVKFKWILNIKFDLKTDSNKENEIVVEFRWVHSRELLGKLWLVKPRVRQFCYCYCRNDYISRQISQE